jgi:hypothetical protein
MRRRRRSVLRGSNLSRKKGEKNMLRGSQEMGRSALKDSHHNQKGVELWHFNYNTKGGGVY